MAAFLHSCKEIEEKVKWKESPCSLPLLLLLNLFLSRELSLAELESSQIFSSVLLQSWLAKVVMVDTSLSLEPHASSCSIQCEAVFHPWMNSTRTCSNSDQFSSVVTERFTFKDTFHPWQQCPLFFRPIQSNALFCVQQLNYTVKSHTSLFPGWLHRTFFIHGSFFSVWFATL